MIKKIHVYDLDGVLIDSSHRYRNLPNGSIDLDYWMQNRTPEKIKQDKLLPLAKKFSRDAIDPEIYTVICTARLISVPDLQYIIGNLGSPSKLIMRPENDTSPDAKLKNRELSRLFNLRQFWYLPKFFWEDNQKNIAAVSHLFTRCFHIKSRICSND